MQLVDINGSPTGDLHAVVRVYLTAQEVEKNNIDELKAKFGRADVYGPNGKL